MDRSKLKIALLSDGAGGILKADLDLLYPERVTAIDFTSEAHDGRVLRDYTHVITAVFDGKNLGKLDYGAVRRWAKRGGQVISCLFEYAADRGWRFAKTHVRDRVEPTLRIMVENDVTKGFAIGDSTPWYGNVSSAPNSFYNNQMYQRQIMTPIEDETTTILARSNLNQGTVILEERVGEGRILALDMMSPGRPFYNSHGSTNKFLFLGNFIGQSVRYGKHYPTKLSYDEFVVMMREFADAHDNVAMIAEGPASDGREMYSLRIGEATQPTVYYGAAVHGWEWENCYGLMRLAELVAENKKLDCVDTAKLNWVIMPVQNPYGFDHFLRQNADGVDLNRNFDNSWEDFPMPQDLAVPWDYNYKGPRAASALETQTIQRVIDETKPVGLIDFHTAHYILMQPHRGDFKLIGAVHEEMQERLADKFMCQAPYNGAYQQVNMDRITDPQDAPYVICYAAKQGCKAAVLIEMSGNRDGMHGSVMTTDTVVELCLAMANQCIESAGKRK